MSAEHLYVLVEEPSMQAFLETLLPRLLSQTTFEIITFQGKPDLLSKLPDRLRGYSHFLRPTERIVVVVDRDSDNCTALKERLEKAAHGAGLQTRSSSLGSAWRVANRIVVEELEAWYFGDWAAVCSAYPRISASVPAKAKFRNPDAIRGGTAEAFQRLASEAGYFRGGLRKTEAAEKIASKMDSRKNTSRSFQVLRDLIIECATSE